MTAKMNILDFGLVPDLNHRRSTVNLPKELGSALLAVPLTLDRASAAIKFTWLAQLQPDSELRCHGEEDCRKLREAFLRAALCEYASIEDVLKRELEIRSINVRARRIRESQNPLVLFIKELRNFQVHLHSAELSAQSIEVSFAGPDLEPNPGTEHITKIWVTDPLVESELTYWRNRKHYSEADVSEMFAWFNEAQRAWGVADLVFRAVVSYCEEITVSLQLPGSNGTVDPEVV